jgi:hypothetical protein
VTLRVIGAGVARTGTSSLKIALQHLLGGDCYHMDEVLLHQEHVAPWEAALGGNLGDWQQIFGAYVATVDWPAAAFWAELAAFYPDALVILSYRDEEEWWHSAQGTFVELMSGPLPDAPEAYRRSQMALDVVTTRFCSDISDREAMKRAYRSHNEAVRNSFDSDRLLDWHPADGWAPLCYALGVNVPSEPFPHHNTRSEFRKRFDLPPSTPAEAQ